MTSSGTPFSSGPWRGVVADASTAQEFAHLDSWLAEHPGEVVVQYLSREVRRVTLEDGRIFYVKIIRALTDAGLQGREYFSWCKWVFRPSRAVGAFRISKKMLELGVECAPPVLAVRCRKGIVPTDIFITAAVPYADMWEESANEDGIALAAFLAQELSRFHRSGFAHGDCILRNLCRNPNSQRAVFLDNDRTWRPPFFCRGYYQRRNLYQMAYSLIQRFPDGEASRHFLAEYGKIPGGASLSKSTTAKIMDYAQKRLARRLQRQQQRATSGQ